MKSYLSKQVEQLKPSGIRRFFDLAAGMEGVISLGVGEPDFVTPWSICEASISSLERGYTAYTANAGLMELRQEIVSYLHSQFHVTYDAQSEVIVTVGGSQALDIAMRAILDSGDEVIIPEPTFVSYAPLVSLAGGHPVGLETTIDTEFKLKADQLEKAITPKTKALLLCSPNNPTGSLLTKEELEEISANRR